VPANSPASAQLTRPYGVVPVPKFLGRPWLIVATASAGNDGATASPGRYRDGADDARIAPSGAITMIAVIASSPSIGPETAGTFNSMPSGAS
jgi:hypothetical protein